MKKKIGASLITAFAMFSSPVHAQDCVDDFKPEFVSVKYDGEQTVMSMYNGREVLQVAKDYNDNDVADLQGLVDEGIFTEAEGHAIDRYLTGMNTALEEFSQISLSDAPSFTATQFFSNADSATITFTNTDNNNEEAVVINTTQYDQLENIDKDGLERILTLVSVSRLAVKDLNNEDGIRHECPKI